VHIEDFGGNNFVCRNWEEEEGPIAICPPHGIITNKNTALSA